MRIALSPSLRIGAGLLLAALLSIVGYQLFRRRSSHAPEALLKRADDLSWLNAWIQAEPLYRQAEIGFRKRGNLSKALYARVSQIPAQSESSTTVPNQIAMLRHDLELPEARDPETRLRILIILGMLETNYDAGMAPDLGRKSRSWHSSGTPQARREDRVAALAGENNLAVRTIRLERAERVSVLKLPIGSECSAPLRVIQPRISG